jgi:methionine-rich copper-binding protein CopC
MNTDHTLTVVASDGMFEEPVNVHIIVLDVDDNCPTFDNKLYETTLSSLASIGSEVVSLKVTDPDEVTVFDAAISGGDDEGLFDISGTNVVVAKNLSGFGFTSHTLMVTVALPGCSNSTTINIVIISSDASYQFEKNEEQSGALVGKIIDDEEFPDAKYTIVLPVNAPFTIDNRSVITSTKMLDHETDPSFTLIVELQVFGAVINLTVEIHVLDVNDNEPVFVGEPYSGSVMENAEKGQSVAKVFATDADMGANGEVIFSIRNVTAFTITPDGNITVSGSIDYEIQCNYEFEVQAVDQGSPQKTSSAQVMVEVINVNEFDPEFQPDSYSVEVSESLSHGASVIQVFATDNDGCPGQPPSAITFSFIGMHEGFAVSETSGLITVDGSLTPGFHSLNVSASDGERQDTVSVEVNVTVATSPVVDLNGNMPGINNHLTMTSGIPKVNLASSGTVTLPQNGIIESMTITITNPVDDDSERLEADLETADSTNIEVQYDSDTHQLTLNGSASASAYQAALRTVRYVNDRMEDVLSMSLMSVKRNRVITVSASTLDATSEVASATVSFNRNCGSSVTASSNAELEQMAVCVEISGSATINCPTSSCDIEDLVILSDLMKVTGKLTIERTKVKNLAGLENLQTYGSLRITLNTELESISELREKYADLLEVSDIEVQECGLLQDISGLRGIENVTGDLVIEGNAVTSLTGLDNLTYVKGDFKLSDNHMKTLDGLGMLQSVGGSLTISDNKKLTSLNGLSSLTSIGGLFTVSTNEELVCLSTLQCADKQPVTDVGDSMLFMLNPKACFEESFWKALANSGSQVLLLMNGDTENCNCDC